MRPAAAATDDDDDQDPEPNVQEVESFYRDKIADINRQHEESVRMLKFRLKRFECRTADDEYMVCTQPCMLLTQRQLHSPI